MNLEKKLIIQIPCYNEAQNIAIALSNLPREVEGFGKVEWLVIDDGSTDNTAEAAKTSGADYIVTFSRNRGLAKAFMAGLNACLERGADVIVNTDADNQYNAQDIPNLVKPILEGKADIVVGVRVIDDIEEFSYIKKLMQKFGSWVVSLLTNTTVSDATSGFRAISRETAMQLNIFSNFTYTLEMIIQSDYKNMSILTVPIKTNKKLRPSRLFKSVLYYIAQSISTIIRIFVVYRPFRFFILLGSLIFLLGFLIGLRYLYYFFFGDASGHIQSLILASILTGIGFQTMIFAFLAELQSVNRLLMEDLQYRLKSILMTTKEHRK